MLKALALTSASAALPLGGGPRRLFAQPDAPSDAALFPLSAVRLLDGPFKEAQERNRRYLAALEPDRLLYWHRRSAGLEPKADPYGGWEENGSNILGHYLTACALMHAATGDEALAERVGYVVDELAACQKAVGTGALYNDPGMVENFEKLAAGEMEFNKLGPAFPFVNRQNPWYGMHKVFAGLRDAHRHLGSEKAKRVMIGFADWTGEVMEGFTNEQLQRFLDVEHGGMCEVMADVYGITGDDKYFALAQRLVHRRVAEPTAAGRDVLYPEHANTQIPKFVGYARLFALAEERAQREGEAASNFWDLVLQNHTLSFGGNSEYERFGLPGRVSERIGYSSAETCNTYNMLKLSKMLYGLTGQPGYMAYYERALLNHVFAALGPEEGMFCYYVSTRPGFFKSYSTAHDSNWCCVGTGMENPAKYGEAIYARAGRDVYVNLFMPSRLTWPEEDFALRQETQFPESEEVRLVVEKPGAGACAVHVRRPAWVKEGAMEIQVNGAPHTPGDAEGGYAAITRAWEAGDEITVRLPMRLRVMATPDNPNIASLAYGPVVLAGDLGKSRMDEVDQRIGGDPWANEDAPEMNDVPVLVGDRHRLEDWIAPARGRPLTFEVQSAHLRSGTPGGDEERFEALTLRPLYDVVEERYSVYWDLYAPDAWQRRHEARAAHIKDQVVVGRAGSEAAHGLQGQQSLKGTSLSRAYRGAEADGWFSYALSTGGSSDPLFLVCHLDGGRWGPEPEGVLDVFVEDNLIMRLDLADRVASVDFVDRAHPTLFYDVVRELPPQYTAGKGTVTVRFQAKTDVTNSGLFRCQLVTSEGLSLDELLVAR